jgi:hypothetical protein
VKFVRFDPPPALAGFGIVAVRDSGSLALGLRGPVLDAGEASIAALTGGDDLEARRRDRYGTFALIAARQALEQAGRADAAGERCGVMIGTTYASAERNGRYARDLAETGAALSPSLFVRTTSGAAAADIAFAFKMGGPGQTFVSGWTAGAEALAAAARVVSRGAADLIIAGGVEVPGPIFGRTAPALMEGAAMAVVVPEAPTDRPRLLAYGRGFGGPAPGDIDAAREAARAFECDAVFLGNSREGDPWNRRSDFESVRAIEAEARRSVIGEQVGPLGAAGVIAACAGAAEVAGRRLVLARDPSGDIAALVLG